MNFNSVLIGSADPERLASYYSKLFGEPTWRDDAYAGWLIGSGAISVGPHSEVSGRNDSPGRILLNIETEDVRGNFHRMRAAGAIVVREPYTLEGWPDGWIATLEDPDGNYFQLMSPMGPDAA